MSDEELLPGFNAYYGSLLEKLAEPLETYVLYKMKLDQFRKQGTYQPTIEVLHAQMMASKGQIAELLIQEKDIPWISQHN